MLKMPKQILVFDFLFVLMLVLVLLLLMQLMVYIQYLLIFYIDLLILKVVLLPHLHHPN
jgi:hypothetical protein